VTGHTNYRTQSYCIRFLVCYSDLVSIQTNPAAALRRIVRAAIVDGTRIDSSDVVEDLLAVGIGEAALLEALDSLDDIAEPNNTRKLVRAAAVSLREQSGTSTVVSNLTKFRAAVLAKVTAFGATEESPLRLHGAEFKAGIWLYEHNLLGQNYKGFFPV
jgi:protein-disulfide isomerase-like protein with CxxC motif